MNLESKFNAEIERRWQSRNILVSWHRRINLSRSSNGSDHHDERFNSIKKWFGNPIPVRIFGGSRTCHLAPWLNVRSTVGLTSNRWRMWVYSCKIKSEFSFGRFGHNRALLSPRCVCGFETPFQFSFQYFRVMPLRGQKSLWCLNCFFIEAIFRKGVEVLGQK